MSNITNDARLNPVWHRMLYSCSRPYGNSGRQRVNRRGLTKHCLGDGAARMTSSEATLSRAHTAASRGHVTSCHVTCPTSRRLARPDVTSLAWWSTPDQPPVMTFRFRSAGAGRWAWSSAVGRGQHTKAGSRMSSACAVEDVESVAMTRHSAWRRTQRSSQLVCLALCNQPYITTRLIYL